MNQSHPAVLTERVSLALSELTNLNAANDAPPPGSKSLEKVQDSKCELVSLSRGDKKPANAMTKLESLKESMKKLGIRRSSVLAVPASGNDSSASRPAESKDKTTPRPARSTAADFMTQPARDGSVTTFTPCLGDGLLGLQSGITGS